MEIVGTVVEANEDEKTDDEDEINVKAEDLTPAELDKLSLTDLEELLKMALQEERYELAVTIRDAIKRKNNTITE